MQIRCPQCNATQPAAFFCNNCGIKFDYSAPLPRKQKPAPNGFTKWFAKKTGLAQIVLISLPVFFIMALLSLALDKTDKPANQPAQLAAVDPDEAVIGRKPLQSSWDGEVLPVKRYLRGVLNDYDSSEFVEWSPVTKATIKGQKYWAVRLKLRAKNAFGGYIIKDTYYYMKNDEVVFAEGLSGN